MSEHARQLLGRPRPPYEPKSVQCASCGSPQSVADERAVQLVCGACGATLELSGTEAAVLRQGRPGGSYPFPLALDAPFKWKGHRWRVTARLALTEDDDPGGVTRVYYLYSPRRGPLYLDEYGGQWCLSWDTHVQPLSDPFSADEGQRIQTGDGRAWAATDGGSYRVAWVDGALPWVQQVGDRIRYAEFRAIDGSEDLLDAEGQGREVEMGLGQALTPEQVRAATGNPRLPASEPEKPSLAVRATDRWPLGLLAGAACAALVFNGLVWAAARGSGEVVLRQKMDPYELEGEALTNVFRVPRPGDVLAVEMSASSLSNAWMAVDFALVGASETVFHVDDVDLEYYFGTEGGESWSEGSRSETALFRVPEAGDYRLLVHAVDGRGETEVSSQSTVPLHIEVRAGAMPTSWSVLGMVGAGAMALLMLLLFKARSGWDDDDD